VDEIHVEFDIRLVADASLELFPDCGACVVRLDPLKNCVERRRRPSGVET
jgi:hypothetical protein